MKRSPLQRRTPLKAKTPLTSRTPLRRSASLPGPRTPPRTSGAQKPAQPRERTGPTDETEALVEARDGGRCVVCGLPGTPGDPLTVHHRANRGQGGSRAANGAANLLLVHSVVNGLWEADAGKARQARESGWKVSRYVDPAAVPARYPDGWWLLDNDGGRRRVEGL